MVFISGLFMALSFIFLLVMLDSYRMWGDNTWGVVSFFVIFIIFVILFFGCKNSQKVTTITSVPLVAMSNGASISGSFFLGTGNIGGDEILKYVYSPDQNDKRKKKIGTIMTVEKVTIIEDDSLTPVFRTIISGRKYNEFATKTEYEFIIPKDSVKEIFSVDISK